VQVEYVFKYPNNNNDKDDDEAELQKYNFHLLVNYENALINRLLVQCI
jgi:hypothetical protein